MRERAKILLVIGVVTALAVIYFLYDQNGFVANRPLTARIIPSRTRIRAGEVVDFRLDLVDDRGRTHRIPSRARSGQPPQVRLLDSGGTEIGTYKLRYG